MEREPTSKTEQLTIDVNGTIHRGRRVVLVVSDTEVRQEVRYKELRRVDPDVYSVADRDFMSAIAREILWRLVAQWKTEQARRPAPRTSGPSAG
jgi:hypothetical protein